MRFFVFVMFVVMLSGCASWDTHLQSQSAMYRNKPVEEMYKEYGQPTKVVDLKNGEKHMDFVYFRDGFRCTASVFVDINGNVTTMKVGGQNGCIIGRY